MSAILDLAKVKLPTLPAAAIKVIQLVQDPDVDVPTLGKVIEMDPALAARLVRLANSSLFGLTREITSVRQALVILGLRTVKLAALSFSLVDSLGKSAKSESLSFCWRQILTNAMACRLLGPLFNIDSEEAFLAGLLQDLGILVCSQNHGPKYLELVEKSRDENAPNLDKLELEAYGFTHSQVGVQLIKHWRLPERLGEAISVHEQVDLRKALADKHLELEVLLAAADAITGFLLKPSADNVDRFTTVSEAFGELSSEVDKFVQRLEVQVKEMAELLELNLPPGQSAEEVVARARELTKELRVESREQLPLRVKQELARAHRENWCLALVLVRFTTISQLAKAGEVVAAEAMQRDVARMLQEVTRECDALFRLNLSTFAILATNTPQEGVERLIQRLMPQFQGVRAEFDGEEVPMKFCFGVILRQKDSKDDTNVESFLLKGNDNLSDAVSRGETLVLSVL